MKPLEHYRASREAGHPRGEAALSVLPDVFVAASYLPSQRVKRWCAWVHHSHRGLAYAERVGPKVGRAWLAHYVQDQQSHPAGTYKVPEAAGLPSDVVVTYSGGPDSFIAWRLLGCPKAVYVAFDHDAAAQEQHLVRDTAEAFGGRIVIAPGVPLLELPSGWIPYRNLVLILAAQRLSPNVVLARIAEWGPDKNPAFFRRLERLLRSSRGGYFQAAADLPPVKIYTPFGHLTKTQLVGRYLEEYGFDQGRHDLMTYTRSCYAAGDKFCGECGGCFCRWVAFTNNRIDESERYAKIPVKLDYYRRLHWRDFRPGMVPMYVKRYLEMRDFA